MITYLLWWQISLYKFCIVSSVYIRIFWIKKLGKGNWSERSECAALGQGDPGSLKSNPGPLMLFEYGDSALTTQSKWAPEQTLPNSFFSKRSSSSHQSHHINHIIFALTETHILCSYIFYIILSILYV